MRRSAVAVGVIGALVGAGVAVAANGLEPSAPAVVNRTATRVSLTDLTHDYRLTAVDTFDEAWAMAFLPGTDDAVITERPGRMILRNMSTGSRRTVAGVPAVAAGGQGGLGDIVPGPRFASDRTVFLSWAEAGSGGTRGAVVGRARLDISDPRAPRLTGLRVIWRQTPKVGGTGHYAHRLAVSPDGRYLFVTSGDRRVIEAAQDPRSDLGKVVRIELASERAVRWSLGHRNPLGIAFAPDGRLWSSEMGPRGGDELNLIRRGSNYGWPRVSDGDHYDGRIIPDHGALDAPPGNFAPPAVSWNPSISPGSLMIYRGRRFPNWTGDAFLGALSGQALVRVELIGDAAFKAERWPMGARIRVVVEGPDGAIWLIEDGPGGRLLRMTPR